MTKFLSVLLAYSTKISFSGICKSIQKQYRFAVKRLKCRPFYRYFISIKVYLFCFLPIRTSQKQLIFKGARFNENLCNLTKIRRFGHIGKNDESCALCEIDVYKRQVRALLPYLEQNADCDLNILCGSNEALFDSVEAEFTKNGQITPMHSTNKMALYLKASDCLLYTSRCV